MTNDRITYHLENWRDYMKRDTHKLGYPAKSLMIASGGGNGIGIDNDAFDIMTDEMDINLAQKMDSIIDSISKPQRVAINHVWLGVPHHYPTQEMDYEEALESIGRLADKRGLM